MQTVKTPAKHLPVAEYAKWIAYLSKTVNYFDKEIKENREKREEVEKSGSPL